MKILVVDDEPILGNTIVKALQREFDAEVLLAADGERALALSEAHAFDVVVLDHTIPPPSGVELLRRWRNLGSTCPVLMLSGWPSETEREDALAMGANDYLTKPFSLTELTTRIRRLVAHA